MYTTQIIDAINRLDLEDVKFFFNKGETDLNKMTDTGSSVLLLACQKPKSLDIVKFLIENGADVNIRMTVNTKVKNKKLVQSQIGTTPLMMACMLADEKLVNYLLSKGADKNLVTDGNHTALDFVKWTFESRQRGIKTKELAKMDFSNFKNIIKTLSAK